MVISISIPEPFVYMIGAEDLISNLGAGSPSIETIEVFNFRSRSVRHEIDQTLPQRWLSNKLRYRSTTGITSPDVVAGEHRPTTNIKIGLSKTPRGLGSISTLDDIVETEYMGVRVRSLTEHSPYAICCRTCSGLKPERLSARMI
ncbi:hypothetical protein F4782DRAFT_186274 [Xylaria castorea]|nr:hypothetical protein F4782DRAFT_186274 [Xylaria castorea]